MRELITTFFYYCRCKTLSIELFRTSAAAQRECHAASTSTAFRCEVPTSPLPVQRRIAGILSAYDELIENSQRRIRILEAMARALYREWFVHFRFPGHEKSRCVRLPPRRHPPRLGGEEACRDCVDINPRES